MGLGVLSVGKNLAQFVVDVGIGSHSGPHVDADGRGIDELDLLDALGCYRLDMGRQRTAHGTGPARAGTRLSRISVVLPEPDTPVTTVSLPLGDVYLQRVHRVNGIGGKVDAALGKEVALPRPGRQRGGRRAQKRSDHRLRVLLNFGHSALSR